MSTHDPRVDAYIDEAAEFARPILAEIRTRVHAACPKVGETIKWGMPGFVHAGGILCQMAAFKRHVSFGYWNHALVMGEAEREGMGSYGKMASAADLPPKATMRADLGKAMRLNEDGVKPERRKPMPRDALEVPDDLAAALEKHQAAKAAFDGFAPSHRREYLEWIVEARREETRTKRIVQAVEWMAEGKRRNWKYERC
jgi:uncharacterized protein YdeI (YjbR/CyaY-like superfamily)